MATTDFHLFAVTFADALPGVREAAQEHASGPNGHVYRIEEGSPGCWQVWENGRRVDMTSEQNGTLSRCLEALRPMPDEDVKPQPPGCDGTWNHVLVRTGSEARSFMWWVQAPPGWERLEAVTRLVRELAEAPRRALEEQNCELARQFFERLAARDVEGAMALCAPKIEYSSPFFEKNGLAPIALMWKAWLHALPDACMTCANISAGPDSVIVNWKAEYVFPDTKRHVQHALSADLGFDEGKIIRHRDRFNLHEWTQQAYGAWGRLLGGQSAFQKWAVARERARLASFESAFDGSDARST